MLVVSASFETDYVSYFHLNSMWLFKENHFFPKMFTKSKTTFPFTEIITVKLRLKKLRRIP